MSIVIDRGAALEFIRSTPAFMIADSQVAACYPDYILPYSYVVASNENLKTFDAVEKFIIWLAEVGANRGNAIIALGGGTVGDMAGFAASVYMRGVRFYNVPTTLLAMVDSSIGGKTAVNVGGIKNLAGAFHEPSEVVIDPTFLATISEIDYLSGLGEVIKTAAIADHDMFDTLLHDYKRVLARDIDDLIAKCAEIKAKIVEEDLYDHARRIILNAGHTIAHAIESDSHYQVPHGHAVATGLYLETLAGVRLGHVESDTSVKIAEVLRLYGYPLSYKPVSDEGFQRAMLHDKKSADDGVTIPFVRSIGEAECVKLANFLPPLP